MKLVISAVGWISIVATTGAFDGAFSWVALGMFTTQSNILCAVYFTIATGRLLAGKDRTGRPFAPVFKGIATMSVVVTFLVAWLILHMAVSFESAAGASLLGLHILVPLMAVADTVLFDARGQLRWRDAFYGLTAPLLYLAEFVIVTAFGGQLGAGMAGPGASTSSAPYPFLDVATLGVAGVSASVLAIAVGVLLCGIVGVALDRLVGRRRHR